MGIEPTQNLEIKRLPKAGGIVRRTLELRGIVNGRELDVRSRQNPLLRVQLTFYLGDRNGNH